VNEKREPVDTQKEASKKRSGLAIAKSLGVPRNRNANEGDPKYNWLFNEQDTETPRDPNQV